MLEPPGQIHISQTPKHPGPSWHLPVLMLSAALGWLQGQKQPLGYISKLRLRAQTQLGLEQSLGTLRRPVSTGFSPCAHVPCPFQPLVPGRRSRAGASPARARCLPPSAGSRAPAAPRHRPPAHRAAGFAVSQPQGSTPAVPCQPGPLPPSFLSAQLWVKSGILFPRSFRLLDVSVCPCHYGIVCRV